MQQIILDSLLSTMNGVGILRILFKEMAKELNVELR